MKYKTIKINEEDYEKLSLIKEITKTPICKIITNMLHIEEKKEIYNKLLYKMRDDIWD